MSNTQLTNDDLLVQSQDYIDNLNWRMFAANKLLDKDPNSKVTFIQPKSMFNTFDLLTQWKSHDIYVELKERKAHYTDAYMIDVDKVTKLRQLMAYAQDNNSNSTVVLAILEPTNNKIYTFNFNRIDWDNVKMEKRWVKKSELRTQYEGQYTEKPFYFLDWSLAREHSWRRWKKGTQPQPMPTN